MEFKRLISHFVYRIEAKPGGGFIARASDPAVPPIEAATRAELQQKIQATIAANLATVLPGLKLPLESSNQKFDFHIEHKPEGGFEIHAADPNAEPIEIATHDDLESHVVERLIGLAGKHLSPELAQALSTPGASADVKVSTGKTFTITAGSKTVSFSNPQSLPPSMAQQANDAEAGLSSPPVDLGTMQNTISNTPINFESSGSSLFFRLVLVLVVIGALAYVFFYHR